MAKRRAGKKKDQNKALLLDAGDMQELDLVMDRLRVQCPGGDSLEHCLRSFRAALADRPLLVAALLERLSKEATPVTHQAYLALKDLVLGTPYERLLRQADYRFRQRGLEPPTGPGAGSRPRPLVLVPGGNQTARAAMIVGAHQEWSVAALVPTHPGNFVFIALILDFHWRIQYLKITECFSRDYKEYLRQVKDAGKGFPIEVPIWHVAGMFIESLDHYPEQRLGQEAARAAGLLQPYLEPERRPYPYDVLPECADPQATVDGVEFNRIFELVAKAAGPALALPRELVRPYWERMQAVDHSVLAVSREIKLARMDDVIEEAADALFDPDRIHLIRRFFEELALCLHMQRHESAAPVWALAQHLRAVTRPGASRLLRTLVSASIYMHWAAEMGVAKPDGSSDRTRAEDGLRRTESGLILV
ncbi:MAG: hypothetical protein AUK55_12110 [Syntrophobacteraceae bacterium CG2_30_61_12]|nr:MAG: hypothetical protein AUK55_12110 [Syntrophobacteraceae bacterium CG2_30_61_12]